MAFPCRIAQALQQLLLLSISKASLNGLSPSTGIVGASGL